MSLHPLLERQLRQLGATDQAAPAAEEWRAFLERVNRTYEAADRDRYLVERSLAISSTEMADLYEELRRSSESELAAERDRLRTVIESIGDGLCVLDADGAILFANPEARRLLARSDSAVMGRRLGDVVRIKRTADDSEGLLDGPSRGAAFEAQRHDDALFECSDGRSFPASYVLNPIAADGVVAGLVLVFRDITASKRAEEDLRRQRDYAAALVGAMQDGLSVLSPDGILTEVSPRFCAMTGFAQDELVGSGPPYPYWPEADHARLERGFRRVLEDGSAEWDLEFRRKDGERFPVILTGSALRSAQGQVIGYLGTVKDVTERKRAASRLARSEAENRRLAAEQAALRRVATAVAAETEPAAVFSLIAREAAALLGVECGLVARFEEESAVPIGWWGAEQARLNVTFPLRGGGGLAQVHREGRPARVDDYGALAADPVGRIALAARYRSGVAAPVRVAGRAWGAVLAATTRDEPIGPDAEERLAHFAELAALAVANADAQAEIERHHGELQDRTVRLEQQRAELRRALGALRAEKERLEGFYRFGESVASEIALESLADAILTGVCRYTGATRGILYAGERQPSGAIPLAAALGPGPRPARELRPADGAPGRALAERRTVEADLAEGDAPGAELRSHNPRELHVPLVHGARALGVLSLVRAGGGPFSSDDIAAIEHLCNHAAMGLATALSLRHAQRQAEMNRAVLETAHDASIAIDAAGLVVAWNAQAERIFGWPRAEVVGRPFAETVIASSGPRREIALLLAGGESHILDRPLELDALRRDGEPFPVEITISRIPLGEAVGLHAFARDVSARKRAESYAAAQHAVTRVLAESGRADEARPRLLQTLGVRLGCEATALWSVDADAGRLVCDGVWAASPRIERAVRAAEGACPFVSGADVPGRAWSSGEPAAAAASASTDAFVRRLAAEAEIQGVLCLPIRGEGAVIGVLGLLGACAESPQDDLVATMTVVSGQLGQFFERKRAEREAERVKDEFVALVSHELRTPLTSIVGYVEILADGDAGPLVDEQRRFLGVLERNARRLQRLVDDLLFIAQFESGEFALDSAEPLDLADLAVEALNTARPSADDRGVAITLSCAPNRARLLGDRDRLSQVFDNLISNAVKFTPAGGSVRVGILEVDGDAIIEVADDGIGIPEAEQERLFQRFFRASTASQRHIAGVGLGLSIVRAIVEAHGGSVGLRSAHGSGTTFQVRLPLRPPIATAGSDEPGRRATAALRR